jgi:hypothetical protein
MLRRSIIPDGTRWNVLEPLESRPVGQEVERVAEQQRLRVRDRLNLGPESRKIIFGVHRMYVLFASKPKETLFYFTY